MGGPATTVTIRGTNFASATVAKILATTNIALKTTYYSPTAISVVIPAPQLVAGTPLTIIATNPGPGGDSASNVILTFGQSVDAAVNAASYAAGPRPVISTRFSGRISVRRFRHRSLKRFPAALIQCWADLR